MGVGIFGVYRVGSDANGQGLGFTERRGFCCHGTGALAGGHRKDMNFGYWRWFRSNLMGARAYDLVVY